MVDFFIHVNETEYGFAKEREREGAKVRDKVCARDRFKGQSVLSPGRIRGGNSAAVSSCVFKSPSPSSPHRLLAAPLVRVLSRGRFFYFIKSRRVNAFVPALA